MTTVTRTAQLGIAAAILAFAAPLAAEAGGGKPSKPVITKPAPAPAPQGKSFGMMSGAAGAAIKSIGDGLSNLARK